jgi:hypothetical protein
MAGGVDAEVPVRKSARLWWVDFTPIEGAKLAAADVRLVEYGAHTGEG